MATTRTNNSQAETQALINAGTVAGQAPSIHNTQPWRWQIDGNLLKLFIADSRALAVTDPNHRLAILSCGAALHHALVSLAADGRPATVTRLPDPAEPRHLATVRVGAGIPVEPEAIRHFQTIGLRHTDRRPVLGTPVDAGKLSTIAAAAQERGALLHLLRPDQVFDLATASGHAQRAEADETAWQAEIQHWTGGVRPLGTGVPDSAIPREAAQTTVPGRDFGHPGTLETAETHDRAATFAVLYGPADDDIDWLRAGEALSAAWLTATELGISVLPLSAAIEVVATRETVRHLLAGLGYPYLVLRLGVTDPDAAGSPHTPRLPADQTVERR